MIWSEGSDTEDLYVGVDHGKLSMVFLTEIRYRVRVQSVFLIKIGSVMGSGIDAPVIHGE